jgi:hypothetical protein
MRKRIPTLASAILCLALPACSLMTKSGRQQLAYRNYVRKHTREQDRRIARAQPKSNRKFRLLPSGAPKETVSSESPQALTSGSPQALSSGSPQALSSSEATTGEGENRQAEP